METFYATGKRKTSIARVWLRPGNGDIVVNKKPLEQYFEREIASMILRQPFESTQITDKFDVWAFVKGGGKSGQAEAIRHAIAKALANYNSELKPVLKKAGFIKRDARIKERKKYGQKGARARFQFSKR
ncbi:MAG: 30S ribosomal protein S9 [Syntrophobacter sp. DG_60]|nr:MAG: 30S ribosomal protein S9 [Syntrophobacter sp. DG_60]